MKNIKTIEEIRINIDKIDLEILNLIEKRKKLVDSVVKLKTKDEIVDQERIEKILRKLDLEAKKKMLPSKMIKDIWENMINGFIEYEKRYFEKKNSL
jgi:chorismate mutase